MPFSWIYKECGAAVADQVGGIDPDGGLNGASNGVLGQLVAAVVAPACKLFEHEDLASADPTGEWFTFEKGATKTGGGEGFADVWKKILRVGIQKEKRDLNAAMDQLVRYAAALETTVRPDRHCE